MVLLYRAGLFMYLLGIKIASLKSAKARAWIKGRKGWEQKLEPLKSGRWIWFHCASLGEFEQGRPLIELARKERPEFKILLTFFSPSGYEIRKNYKGADLVTYLPLDSPANAKKLLGHFHPEMVFFIKYEFWYYLLRELFNTDAKVYLVSAIFRPGQVFFKPWGGIFRKLLRGFEQIFVQDDDSRKLLGEIGIHQVTVAGDTRFDRVLALSKGIEMKPVVVAEGKVIVAGSTWPEDEKILADFMNAYGHEHFRLIVVPHEVGEKHLTDTEQLFPEAVRWSRLEDSSNWQVLIIDTIGLLSSLYAAAKYTYVGGGFGKGIHNTLEAAVYGKPIFFGPHWQKFREARELISTGAAHEIEDAEMLRKYIEQMEQQANVYQNKAMAAATYVSDRAGATAVIANRTGLIK